ncbi:DUF4166 domain-containing protein [Microbacterium oryzae]|uniref:DUF4166 domain-containing protein n=1 Tax=Microbacterium oryzae TaxID=743009 RepID=A0A6I6DXP2_9MICO|nr:DUF4166 domain-containing protein [Microbacterium oryzae]QGU26764.1 DUF4166 domain-containing protein [Microbacterium oryzae]
MSPGASPYARALGTRRADLHLTLREYFDTLPPGHVGIGEGVFDRVGTSRRWLQPLLRPLHRRGVLFAGWEQDVPFRITNRLVAGRLLGERVLMSTQGRWTMRDAVVLNRHGRPVDEIGDPVVVAAEFDLDVATGALRLRSRAVGMRLGVLRLRLPRFLAPVVRLVESFDEEAGAQRVRVTIDLPVIGRIYEYGGTFRYRIEEDT